MTKILAVDDNSEALFALEEILRQQSFEVLGAGSGEQALDLVRSERPDLVLLDVNMPGIDGYHVTEKIKSDAALRYTTVILLTSNEGLDAIVEGLQRGADDYIKKPYRPEELLARVHAALRLRALYQELQHANQTNEKLLSQLGERTSFTNIVGKSRALRAVFDIVEKVKEADVPVLITGESGTGKELIASALHYQSDRRNRAFVAQNCGAFSETLLDSELFGHVKGSFTGALRDKAGLFELADGGTLFLDEVGEMTPALQVKLLRVLQEGVFTPVGGTQLKKAKVRVVAATHRDLKELISKGTFREDLYYRLNVVQIRLPALRERKEDIPLLLEHFLAEFSAKSQKGITKKFDPEAFRALCDHVWPGNIRELKNQVERMYLLSGDSRQIGAELLAEEIQNKPVIRAGSADSKPKKLKEVLEELEKEMIRQTLERVKGNKSEAARELGIARSNLIAKVQEYGLE